MKQELKEEYNRELAEALSVVFSSTFGMYFKAHSYHWNVTGPDFAQYHSFFGDLYEELWAATDVIAESIRTIDEFAPMGLMEVCEQANHSQNGIVPDSEEMMKDLYMTNLKLRQALVIAYNVAENVKNFGVSNMLQARIETHDKHGWMLKSFMG